MADLRTRSSAIRRELSNRVGKEKEEVPYDFSLSNLIM